MNLDQLDLRQLRALLAVVDEGSFARAAQRLGFTQSAISQQVQALERAVGSPVLDRPKGPRKSELTPVGAALVGHARAIVERLDIAVEEIDAMLAGTSGRLTVGTFQSVSVKVLPEIVGNFMKALPGVDVRLFESEDNEELQRRVYAEELDISFVVGPVDDERLELIEVCRDPFVVVCRADDAGPGPVPVRSLMDQAMVGQQGSACQDMIDRGLAQQGVIARYSFRSNDNGAVQNMVKAGMGSAIMPLLAVDPADPGVVIRTLDPPIEPRSILIAVRRRRTRLPAAQTFIDLALEAFARTQESVGLVAV
jgi:DNA-binding transcriptional LysR family regulator